MKSLILIAVSALLACACAAPAKPENEPVPILRSAADGPNPDGSFRYNFETGNGIKAEEKGELKADGEEGTSSVSGSFSFPGTDGQTYVVKYTADENGFRPQGTHLPQPPAIPAAILRALQWIADHPEEDNLRK